MATYFAAEAHERLRRTVREFALGAVLPRVPEMEESRCADQELARLIAGQGWIGVTIGREHGGMALGHLAKTVILEELSRVSGAAGAVAQASMLGVAKIVNFGTAGQKGTWLPAIAAGRVLPTIAVTDPGSGSHVLGMQASAVRDGDEWILNGRKVYVGNSHVGDLHGVVVRTGPGSRGLTAFLVEGDRPGLTLAPQAPAMGLRGFSFGELSFEDCRVPAASMIGGEGNGLDVAYSSSILYGRPNLTAVALGIHQAVVEQTVRYAGTRVLYGRPLRDLPTVAAKVGQMQSRLMTARLAAYHAVHLLDQGRAYDSELVNAKLVNVAAAIDSARQAMEIHGAAGLAAGHPAERCLRDAFHLVAPAGTSDIQLIRLAETAFGTAKGPDWSRRFAAECAASAAAACGGPQQERAVQPQV